MHYRVIVRLQPYGRDAYSIEARTAWWRRWADLNCVFASLEDAKKRLAQCTIDLSHAPLIRKSQE